MRKKTDDLQKTVVLALQPNGRRPLYAAVTWPIMTMASYGGESVAHTPSVPRHYGCTHVETEPGQVPGVAQDSKDTVSCVDTAPQPAGSPDHATSPPARHPWMNQHVKFQ